MRHQFLSRLWQETMESLHQRFEASDSERECKLVRVLEAMESQREQHRTEVRTTVDNLTRLQSDLTELAAAVAEIVHGKGELVKLQASLADNLRLLRDGAYRSSAAWADGGDPPDHGPLSTQHGRPRLRRAAHDRAA